MRGERRDGRADREAPGVSHGAGDDVPGAGALAQPRAGVHHRGSVGDALSGRGVGASARMAGDCGRCRGRGEMGEAARASRARDGGDRAAAPRQGDRVEPRGRGDGAGVARCAGRAGRAVHRLVSRGGRGSGGGKDRQSQMRALLALFARGEERRRVVQPLRRGAECVTVRWGSRSRWSCSRSTS